MWRQTAIVGGGADRQWRTDSRRPDVHGNAPPQRTAAHTRWRCADRSSAVCLAVGTRPSSDLSTVGSSVKSPRRTSSVDRPPRWPQQATTQSYTIITGRFGVGVTGLTSPEIFNVLFCYTISQRTYPVTWRAVLLSTRNALNVQDRLTSSLSAVA